MELRDIINSWILVYLDLIKSVVLRHQMFLNPSVVVKPAIVYYLATRKVRWWLNKPPYKFHFVEHWYVISFAVGLILIIVVFELLSQVTNWTPRFG